ncbi:histidine phosphatase family protein [Aciditerrimonas ferrireducens]|uniref:histidine phosphatase family protein n=1 Tax=Aciditerrimonas ferrireducens TaxID=667306 RepID=UPI0020063603|nr:histidine phosphatase family protein [Aciditerrimonas ferrireducens]MCK4177676.1 histidine phosphatase family protein [Aciditerrimonas ferrireducens]
MPPRRRASHAVCFLVRHGRTPTTGKVLPGRAPGLHLSDEGRRQAEATAERLAALRRPPVAVYASPLERAMETAQPIARALGLRVRPLRGLLELDFGEWTGASLAALRRRREWQAVQHLPSTFRFPGGESFAAMQQRVLATLDDLAERHRGESYVAVSHADPIKAAVAATAGVPLDLFQRLVVSPCSVTALARGGGMSHVLCLNATSDLGELGLS